MSANLITTEGMTVEKHYGELRSIARELEAIRVRIENEIHDYRLMAEELVQAAEQAVNEHDDEFDNLVEEANELVSVIERIDLGSVPGPVAWSMPAATAEDAP